MQNGPKVSIAKGEVFESVGSVFWLMLDFAWFKRSGILISVLIPLTVVTNLLTLVLGNKRFVYLAINCAVNLWVLANVLWIISDMGWAGSINFAVDLLFWLALLATAVAVYKAVEDKNPAIFFQMFRRLKIRAK